MVSKSVLDPTPDLVEVESVKVSEIAEEGPLTNSPLPSIDA